MFGYILRNYKWSFFLAIVLCLGSAVVFFNSFLKDNKAFDVLVIEFVIFSIVGLVIPAILLYRIKCPSCKGPLYLNYLNKGKDPDTCPVCGFEFNGES